MSNDNDTNNETNVIDLSQKKKRSGKLTAIVGELEGVKKHLAVDEKDKPLATTANISVLLTMDQNLRNIFGYDEFAGSNMLMRAPPAAANCENTAPGPYPRVPTDSDMVAILVYIQRCWTPSARITEVRQAVEVAAQQNRYHKIREFLAEVEKQWDGVPRLDTWLLNAYGAEDSAYMRAVGAAQLIGAVRRIRKPGCKHDYMLILEGPQRIGKSTSIRLLFTDDYFTDNLPADLASRDAAFALSGAWGIEFQEVAHLIKNRSEVIKSFLSTQIDRYRAPYAASFCESRRQCVFFGTTNRADYLTDMTGGERFWPVECTKVDLDWLARNRLQIWAEAAVRETSGEKNWIEGEIRAEARVQQDQRMEAEDPWFSTISEYVSDMDIVNIAEMLESQLYLSKSVQNKMHSNRSANILKSLGFENKVVKDTENRPIRAWKRK
jgi:predicted P-loop ATPase